MDENNRKGSLCGGVERIRKSRGGKRGRSPGAVGHSKKKIDATDLGSPKKLITSSAQKEGSRSVSGQWGGRAPSAGHKKVSELAHVESFRLSEICPQGNLEGDWSECSR